MTKMIEQTVSMLEMLPSQEQNFAFEFVKRLVLAWDPDYTNGVIYFDKIRTIIR